MSEMSGTGLKPWEQPMPDAQFSWMKEIISAPSPVGMEAAMTYGVLKPFFERISRLGWQVHQFKGSAAVVLDTHPGRDDLLKVMLIGHADKIRMQVRSIGDDGKIWINSDSFLPGVLVGHEVQLFSEDPKSPGSWRVIDGGTIEAVGAIHFAEGDVRSGSKGINKNMLYLELQIHGEDRRAQIESLGIRAGDPILLKRPIRRGYSPNTFYGAYLDNGLGCFAAAEVARLLAQYQPLDHVRVMCAAATHEEIGRLGSRILVQELNPDIIVALDVSHDFEAAPGVKDQRLTPVRMGKGFSLTYGSVASATVNAMIERAALREGIPMQRRVAGRDTGTDAMASFFSGQDAASASVGFPIRNMHTISETGHTSDVLAAIHAIYHLILDLDRDKINAKSLRDSHIRLDHVPSLSHGAM